MMWRVPGAMYSGFTTRLTQMMDLYAQPAYTARESLLCGLTHLALPGWRFVDTRRSWNSLAYRRFRSARATLSPPFTALWVPPTRAPLALAPSRHEPSSPISGPIACTRRPWFRTPTTPCAARAPWPMVSAPIATAVRSLLLSCAIRLRASVCCLCAEVATLTTFMQPVQTS